MNRTTLAQTIINKAEDREMLVHYATSACAVSDDSLPELFVAGPFATAWIIIDPVSRAKGQWELMLRRSGSRVIRLSADDIQSAVLDSVLDQLDERHLHPSRYPVNVGS